MNELDSTPASSADHPADAGSRDAARPRVRAGAARLRFVRGLLMVVILGAFAGPAHADDDLVRQAATIEAYLLGYPKRALAELAALSPRAAMAPVTERHYVEILHADALIATGETDEALKIADRLERDGESAGVANAVRDGGARHHREQAPRTKSGDARHRARREDMNHPVADDDECRRHGRLRPGRLDPGVRGGAGDREGDGGDPLALKSAPGPVERR